VRQVSRSAGGSCLIGDDCYLVGDVLANWQPVKLQMYSVALAERGAWYTALASEFCATCNVSRLLAAVPCNRALA